MTDKGRAKKFSDASVGDVFEDDEGDLWIVSLRGMSMFTVDASDLDEVNDKFKLKKVGCLAWSALRTGVSPGQG